MPASPQLNKNVLFDSDEGIMNISYITEVETSMLKSNRPHLSKNSYR